MSCRSAPPAERYGEYNEHQRWRTDHHHGTSQKTLIRRHLTGRYASEYRANQRQSKPVPQIQKEEEPVKQLSALLVGLALLMAPADSHAQRELKIGTSKFGTLSNALAHAVAFVATLATPGTRFTPQAHTGSADVIPIVNSGEI